MVLGKSTLIKQIGKLLKPTIGKVSVRGKVGIVFQNPEKGLFEQTVYKDIAFGPRNVSKEDVKEQIEKAIEFVGIPERILRMSPFEISGGEERKVAIAGTIAMEPEILILDEPTSGLDPVSRKEILDNIKRYQNENRIIITISHDINILAEYADKILVLDEGRIAMYENTEEMFLKTEELERLEIELPEITKIFCELKKRGVDVNANIYTLEQAKQEILRHVNVEAEVRSE